MWIPATLLVLAGALTPFSALRARGAPPSVTWSAAAIVFPVLPLLWHALAERRRVRGGGTGRVRGWHRLVARSAGIAVVVLAVAVALLGTRPMVQSVARTPGLGWMLRVTSWDDLPLVGRPSAIRYVPHDAQMIAVANLRRLHIDKLPQLNQPGSAPAKLMQALDGCGFDWRGVRILVAARSSEHFMLVLSEKGLADQGKLACLAPLLLGRLGWQGELTLDRNTKPWSINATQDLPRGVRGFADDDGHLVFVGAGWADAVKTQMTEKGKDVASGRLGAPLKRVDRGGGLWWVGALDNNRNLAMEIDLHRRGVHVHATMTYADIAGSSLPPVTMDVHIPEAMLKDAVQQYYAKGLSKLPDVLPRSILGL